VSPKVAEPHETLGSGADDAGDARTRILDTAYELFSRNGVRDVGIDRIIADAGVAKMTLYRHYASKDELVLAFLDLREQRWTRGWLQAGVERRARRPEDRMLALFDLLDEWFHRDDFESCAFARTLLEFFKRRGTIYDPTVRHLEVVRAVIEEYAEQAGVRKPADVAYQTQILMLGAIVSATRGDLKAARRARGVAELLLEAAR
jgi:AcrR family transcriptional regulator